MLTPRDGARLVRRNLMNRPLRTGLTMLGVALAVMLLALIESFSAGMEQALTSGDKARTLVVYRENRYCPQTSRMPERYTREIESVPGVESVLPIKVFLNNCRTNLDMVTFHGAPPDRLLSARDLDFVAGSKERFEREKDAVLVGQRFAARRGLEVDDKFQFGGITVKVVGIYRSADTTLEGLVLTHLEFLQYSAPVNQPGVVTQFEVKVEDPGRGEEIAREIDARLATAEDPTHTRSMSAFLDRATRDLREILAFGRWFGASCVLVVVVLVANTISMAVHERRREYGVLRAIGFRGKHLLGLVLAEAATLALFGGLLGIAGMAIVIETTQVAVGVEGVQVGFALTPTVVLMSLLVSAGTAAVASLWPALQVVRWDPVRAIRGAE